MFYPQTMQEALWLGQAFTDSQEYYVGYRYYSQDVGALFSDYSQGTGIPFLTSNKTGHQLNMANDWQFGDPGCTVIKYNGDRYIEEYGHRIPCPGGLQAVCQRKLCK